MIVRAAGKIAPGTVSRAFCEEIDVLPTILELLGLPAPDGIQGKSLLAAVSGGAGRSAVFAEFPAIHAVRTRDWKLVRYLRSPSGELYDMNNDPHELNNLWDDSAYAKRRSEMEGLLFDWYVTSQDPLRAPTVDA